MKKETALMNNDLVRVLREMTFTELCIINSGAIDLEDNELKKITDYFIKDRIKKSPIRRMKEESE